MRHFLKIASGLDPWPLIHSLQVQPGLWNQFHVRKLHPDSVNRDVDDILLRYPRFAEGDDFIEKVYAECDTVTWPGWAALPQAHPFVYGLMAKVLGLRLGRVIITRLPPGKSIPLHSDRLAEVEAKYPDRVPPGVYYDRYVVALQSAPGCQFLCGDESVQMAPGDIWWIDHQAQHGVVNNSADDRLGMVIDIRTKQDDYFPG